MKTALNSLKMQACALTGLLCLAPGSARADDLASRGRAVFEQHHAAVVTVQLAMKTQLSFGGRGESGSENRSEATATVIRPDGLTVTSLSSVDPSVMFNRFSSLMGDAGERFRMESEITDLKILLPDGTDLPAEIVLRDRDLDLLFLRPKDPPSQPMPCVDLEKAATADVLDPVVTITRLGQAAGRAHAASFERIAAVVRRPRLFYVPDDTITTTTLGSPAFAMDGRVLGLCVMRTAAGAPGALSIMSVQADTQAAVILPAADVLKVAQQVPTRTEKTGTEPHANKPSPP
ncbi:S1 family peptidase [Limisphaera sp. 4302-co]|uniref:S1 family peptidase n=1 Tax=Limisphaera sp. 4302-co TaxID=3400417 RepID=UPI003C2630DB